MLHHRAAVGIAAGVAGVIVQGLIVQGVEPGGVEGVCHHPAHGAHVEVPVGGAGTVPRAVPQPCREPVILGGMSVHDEDLRVGAVPLHRKGERLVISAATSVLETLVLFLMLPLPQGMYFSPLPCG